jgi:uncharacterized protein DUF397
MSAGLDLSVAEWVKSSHSDGSGGNCLEFSPTFTRRHPHPIVPVRDSKTPHAPALVFPAPDWTGFLTALKSGALPTR